MSRPGVLGAARFGLWAALGGLAIAQGPEALPAPARDSGGPLAQAPGAQAPHVPGLPTDVPCVPPWVPGDGFELAEDAPLLRVRGRLHVDFLSSHASRLAGATGESLDGGRGVRRARVLADLTPKDGWRARVQVDASDSEIDWKDAWIERRGLGPLDVRVGHFREPFGLEALTSATHVPFVERSPATDAFTPGRARGAQVSGASGQGRWQLGVFRAASGLPFPDELGSERAVTGRLTQRLVDEEARLVQLGLSASWRDPGDDGVRVRARAGSTLLPRLVDTGTLDADRWSTGGLEALWIEGPTTLQAELFGGRLDLAGPDADLAAGHVQASHFVTDGASSYSGRRAALGAPDVENVFRGGAGAVELVGRWSRVDLVDGAVDGGRQDLMTLGANFYLAPGSRVMVAWNGLRVGGERADFVLVRLQLEL